jgi:hypothetical protein
MLRILTAILIVIACSPAFAGEGMQHSLGIYGWFVGLKGTIGIADVAEQPVDATFDDLANYIDFAIAGHWEGRGEKTVLLADVAFNNLGSGRDATVANQPITVDGDLQQWIVEFGGGWRTMPEFTVLLVGRAYFLDTGATFSGENNEGGNSVSTSWADIYIGGRWEKVFGGKWTASLRGDVGAGGSDFAWFGQALIGYDISDKFTLAAAYRILSLDHEADVDSADYFKYDMDQSGLGLAVAYKF